MKLVFPFLNLPRLLLLLALICLTGLMAISRPAPADTESSDNPRTENIPPLPAERASLELHAHLFMKEGMTWVFRGDFDGPLRAQDWTDRLSTQANPETLNRSELGVVVVALYANPFFVISLRESIRRQIALAEKFVSGHPEWIIARDAGQARAALAQGRRVLILALEGASGIIETEEDLKEFVDEKGLRIVNLLHLTDDEYGGVAFEPGFKVLSSPWAWLTQLFSPVYDAGSGVRDVRGVRNVRINANGLSEAGRKMAEALIRRHVWLDLAHSSDRAQKELIPLMNAVANAAANAAKGTTNTAISSATNTAMGAATSMAATAAPQPPSQANKQPTMVAKEQAEQAKNLAHLPLPLLYTHTVLRKYMAAERGINLEQLELVRKSDGVLGLMPSDDMLGETPVPQSRCASTCKKTCEGGIYKLAQHYSEMTQVLRPEQLAFGSDYNGGVLHFPPPPCPTGTELDSQGLWNIGQQAAVWDALEKMSLPVPSPRRKIVDHFLDAWERVNPSKPAVTGNR